jgi:hypothetical protein
MLQNLNMMQKMSSKNEQTHGTYFTYDIKQNCTLNGKMQIHASMFKR